MDPTQLLQMIMGSGQVEPKVKVPGATAAVPFKDADHPQWEEAVAIFKEQEGREPSTDSDMEITMQEILAQLGDSETAAEQNTVEAEVLGKVDPEGWTPRPKTPYNVPHPLEQRNSDAVMDNIPHDVWQEAEQIYLDEYGEEGFGGDGSYMAMEEIALDLMSNRSRGRVNPAARRGKLDAVSDGLYTGPVDETSVERELRRLGVK